MTDRPKLPPIPPLPPEVQAKLAAEDLQAAKLHNLNVAAKKLQPLYPVFAKLVNAYQKRVKKAGRYVPDQDMAILCALIIADVYMTVLAPKMRVVTGKEVEKLRKADDDGTDEKVRGGDGEAPEDRSGGDGVEGSEGEQLGEEASRTDEGEQD